MSKLLLALVLASAAFARETPRDPLDNLMIHEQNFMVLNGGDPDRLARDTNLQAIRFRPGPGKSFPVKSFWIESDQIKAYVGQDLFHYPNVANQLVKNVDGHTYFRLIVHPESEVFYRDYLASSDAVRAEDYVAEPGASTRTLRVYPRGHKELSFFAKLSLNRIVGEVRRTIKASEIARSIGVNNTLGADAGTLPSGFHYFPEALGLMPPGMERGGMLVRVLPDEFWSGQTRYIPLFAIYGQNPSRTQTLLEEMIAKSGMPADRFILERIIRPFVTIWLKLAVEHGITLEAHGQNVLIGLGPDGSPDGNWAFRDFGGFNIDFTYREQLGLLRPDLPIATTFAKDYFESRHLIAIRESINDYFTANVFYDLDQLFAKQWQEAGYPSDHLRMMVLAEVNAQIHALRPDLPKLYKEFVNIGQLVQGLRGQQLENSGHASCEIRLRSRRLK